MTPYTEQVNYEIELDRLRRWSDRLAEMIKHKNESAGRLQEENEWLEQSYKSLVEVHDICVEERSELKAENERLREALKEIRDYGSDGICPYGCDAPHIATKALAGEEEE